jgi:hypothetical protein
MEEFAWQERIWESRSDEMEEVILVVIVGNMHQSTG